MNFALCLIAHVTKENHNITDENNRGQNDEEQKTCGQSEEEVVEEEKAELRVARDIEIYTDGSCLW